MRYILMLGLLCLSSCAGRVYVPFSSVRCQMDNDGAVRTQIVREQAYADQSVIERVDESRAVTRIIGFESCEIRHVAVSPDGTRLAYVVRGAGKDGGTIDRIVTCDATTGKDVVEVFRQNARCDNAVFTPDGSGILFTGWQTGVPRLWRVNTSGNGMVSQVSAEPGAEMEADIAMSGKKIVYCTVQKGRKDWVICSMNSDGSERTYLCRGRSPRFSHNGRKIAYLDRVFDEETGKETRYSQVWVMDADGSNAVQITKGSGDCSDPAWSRDDTKLAFASTNERLSDEEGEAGHVRNFNIFLIDAAGLIEAMPITGNLSADVSPAWGTEDRDVFFCSNRGGSWHIWRANVVKRLGDLAKLEPPAAVRLTKKNGKLSAEWDKGINAHGYYIYLRTGKNLMKVNDEPVKAARYDLGWVNPDSDCYVSVSSVGKNKFLFSARSAEAGTSQLKPPPPEKVHAAVSPSGGVTVTWKKREGMRYHVYCQQPLGKNFVKLTEDQYPIAGDVWRVEGKALHKGARYSFAVSAVNPAGFESPLSAPAAVVAGPPETEPAGWGSNDIQNDWGKKASTVTW